MSEERSESCLCIHVVGDKPYFRYKRPNAYVRRVTGLQKRKPTVANFPKKTFCLRLVLRVNRP